MADRARWVVRAGDGAVLSEVLVRAKVGAEAVAEGRVFVGKRRATTADVPVKAGDEVWIAAPQAKGDAAVILYDGGGLVAADKPADVATIPDHGGGSASLLASVARALGVDARTLHPTSRLDRGVSGVVVFARTDAAAARLRSARERGEYGRRYVAITAASPVPPWGEWDAPIGRAKDPRHRRAFGKESTPALSRYAVAAGAGSWALLALEPVTGRTHQLRVHASHAGSPLLGDRVYGGATRLTSASGGVVALDRIALHAARVRIPHGRSGTIELASPIPDALRALWRAGHGQEDDFAAALRDLTDLRG